MSASARNREKVLSIGPDRVRVDGPAVIIEARREFPDWSVRAYSRHAIYFRDQKYYLRQKTAGTGPLAVRYELAPWPAEWREQSKSFSVYDEELVAQREFQAASTFRKSLARAVLLLLYPVLGFCWSGVKRRVLQPLGFCPRSLTGVSAFVTYALVIPDVVLLGWFHGGVLHFLLGNAPYALSKGVFWCDVALLLVLSLDGVIRYSQVLRGDDVPDGFLEWLLGERRES